MSLKLILVVCAFLTKFCIESTLKVCKTSADYYLPFYGDCWDNPADTMNITEIAGNLLGLRTEEHYLTTEDGYSIFVLKCYYTITKENPVILGHATLLNGVSHLVRMQDSLVYTLTSQGYEVWIINFRGTIYSRNHTNYTEHNPEFWNFSYHEIGMYDLRAVVDHVYKQSHGKKSLYIGFSTGGAAAMVYSTELPEEAKNKILGTILVAPAGKFVNKSSKLLWIDPNKTYLPRAMLLCYKGATGYSNVFKMMAANSFLLFSIYFGVICLLFNCNHAQLNYEALTILFSRGLDTSTEKGMTHYGQNIRSGQFQLFDYGTEENLKKYDSEEPPLYPMGKISIPVAMVASNGDDVTPAASDGSFESISSRVESYRIPIYGTASVHFGKIVPADERITYTWNEINVFTNTSTTSSRSCFKRKSTVGLQRKHILKNVNGVAYPGELLAILGSSGAGKTTLLNALTFRSPPSLAVSGVRCINGVAAHTKLLRSQSAYVQQEDLFIGNLTVKEHLIFQALVRMDREIPYTQRMERVGEVISELTLNKCQNTYIGIPGRIKGISGGEQKRLSFASEVLTNPSLMFCDEPTSGLDSFMALNVIQVLKSMAQSGKTVICTIHQPSSELYTMFDKLLLMAEGRVSFLGSPEEAELFFRELEAPCPKNFNPADYFIQLLAIVPGREEACRQAVAMICDRYDKSPFGVRVAVDSVSTVVGQSGSTESEIWVNGENGRSPYKASWCAQFRAVLWRSWLSVIKEPLLVKVRFLQTTIVALLIGAIYFGQEISQDGVMNINGVLFIFLTNMTFQNVFNVINVFCSELPIFLKEHRNGMYRTDVYFLSKTLAELPIFVFMPILFTAVCYYMIGLNGDVSRFFVACGVITLVANASTSFGYLISCVSTTLSMALAIGPPLIMPFLLFGGFFLNINSIPPYFQWLSYMSWFRFGNEALLINQWENVTNIICPPGNSTCPRNGHIVLEIYNFDEGNFFEDIIALCLLITTFRVVAFLALLWKTYTYEN